MNLECPRVVAIVCKEPELTDDDDFGGRCVTSSPSYERDGWMR